jgi:hypothetical protein
MDKVVDNIGKKIYTSNKYYRDLATVMEHPEFRSFFDTYMKDMDDAKLTLMFMNLYETIEKRASVELTPYQKIAFLKQMIDDKEVRKRLFLAPEEKKLSIKDN